MEVKPCPKACQFDWATFEILFDAAIAHMVEEKHCYAHNTSLADLMEYVLAKQRAKEQREQWEIAYGDEDNDTDPGPEFPGGHTFAFCVRKVPAPNDRSPREQGYAE
jgi:hypothetical protein